MAPRGKNTKTAPPRQRAWTWLAKQARAQIRFLIALGVGLAVGFTVPIDETVPRILAGWNVGGWLYLLLVGIKMWRAEVDGIRREAGIERGSRIAVLIAVTLGSLFTLLALLAQIAALKSEHGLDRTISAVCSISTILLSWLLIHTAFSLYYAHEFHSERRGGARGTGGGLKFPGDPTPDYIDVGTTAQTSDVAVTSHTMRGVVMLHGILSFFFNTGVIALAVNMVLQLVQG
jgi:uncharacterized membrane protein